VGRVRYKGDRKGFFPLNRVRDLAELKMLERLAREKEARRRRTQSINTQATPAGGAGAGAAAAAAAVSTGQQEQEQEQEEEPGASASLAARWAQEGGYGGGRDGGGVGGQLVRGYGQELRRVAEHRLGSALEDSRSEVEMAALAVARRGAEITSEAQTARRQQRVERRVAIARRRSHRRHVAAV
jgi:hypothetical protein